MIRNTAKVRDKDLTEAEKSEVITIGGVVYGDVIPCPSTGPCKKCLACKINDAVTFCDNDDIHLHFFCKDCLKKSYPIVFGKPQCKICNRNLFTLGQMIEKHRQHKRRVEDDKALKIARKEKELMDIESKKKKEILRTQLDYTRYYTIEYLYAFYYKVNGQKNLHLLTDNQVIISDIPELLTPKKNDKPAYLTEIIPDSTSQRYRDRPISYDILYRKADEKGDMITSKLTLDPSKKLQVIDIATYLASNASGARPFALPIEDDRKQAGEGAEGIPEVEKGDTDFDIASAEVYDDNQANILKQMEIERQENQRLREMELERKKTKNLRMDILNQIRGKTGKKTLRKLEANNLRDVEEDNKALLIEEDNKALTIQEDNERLNKDENEPKNEQNVKGGFTKRRRRRPIKRKSKRKLQNSKNKRRKKL
jgi:hypothetical protein